MHTPSFGRPRAPHLLPDVREQAVLLRPAAAPGRTGRRAARRGGPRRTFGERWGRAAAALALLALLAPALAAPAAAQCAERTGASAIVFVLPSVVEGELLPGDVIRAYDENGHCAGEATYDATATALTLWGDDAMTPNTDGLRSGEAFRLVRLRGGKETPLRATVSPVYEADAVYTLVPAHADVPGGGSGGDGGGGGGGDGSGGGAGDMVYGGQGDWPLQTGKGAVSHHSVSFEDVVPEGYRVGLLELDVYDVDNIAEVSLRLRGLLFTLPATAVAPGERQTVAIPLPLSALAAGGNTLEIRLTRVSDSETRIDGARLVLIP